MSNRTITDPAASGAGRAVPPRGDFDVHDINRDGRLTFGEFIRFMDSTDAEITAEECQTAFDEIDTDNDGLIDFAQFQVWWNEHY